MAIAYVQKSSIASLTGQTNSLTGPSLTGVASGSCLVLTGTITSDNVTFTISDISDSQGSYTVRSSVIDVVGVFRVYSIVAYLLNASAGTHSVTVTLSGAQSGTTKAELGLTEFSGVALSSAEDAFDDFTTTAANTLDVYAGPITTTDAGALIVGSAGFVGSSPAWGDPTNWTNLFSAGTASTGVCHDSGYWLPGSTQSNYTATWSHNNTAVTASCAGALVVALLPSTEPPLTKKLKLLAHSSAAGATGIAGVVWALDGGSGIAGAEIGEFTGKSFETSLEGDKAVLKVPVADFGGGSLNVNDQVKVFVRNTTNFSDIWTGTIIEE